WLSSWARERLIDVSPHAFTANDFLFFDYPRGIPFSKIEFDAKWRQATTLFQQWGFPLSPVLNTHFHTLSACAQPMLGEAGIKYFYSELAPDSVSRQPSPRYYPSGDPTLTTGQPGNPAIQQIYSGDSTSDCNQPSSL